MSDYKILQIIPAPEGMKIIIETSNENGGITQDIKKPVCLALVEDNGETKIMAVEHNFGSFEPCVQRFATNKEIIDNEDIRVTVLFSGE